MKIDFLGLKRAQHHQKEANLVAASILNGLQQAALVEAGILGGNILVTSLCHQHANFTDEFAQLPA